MDTMWINSPLGKWEQENRVNKALDDAERMRVQGEAGDDGGTAGRGGLLNAASVGLHWLAAHTRAAVESVQMRLAAPAARQDQS
jgi:hypothetical protein